MKIFSMNTKNINNWKSSRTNNFSIRAHQRATSVEIEASNVDICGASSVLLWEINKFTTQYSFIFILISILNSIRFHRLLNDFFYRSWKLFRTIIMCFAHSRGHFWMKLCNEIGSNFFSIFPNYIRFNHLFLSKDSFITKIRQKPKTKHFPLRWFVWSKYQILARSRAPEFQQN